MVKVKIPINNTLAYSDIFNYPLTQRQIWRYLISDKKISQELFLKYFSDMDAGITFKEGFYCFLGREKIINDRRRRQAVSNEKLAIAYKIANYIFLIPSIYFIGISGGLAMRNTDQDDDIDLFIITKKNTLWISRLLILFILQLLGVRRSRKDKIVANKICINMLLDETALNLPGIKKNLFIAHEIAQLMPIMDKNNIYGKFIKTNNWFKKYLPNAGMHNMHAIKNSKNNNIFIYLLNFLTGLEIIEYIAKYFQLFFINKHKSKELVMNNILAFHPTDHGEEILLLYKKMST